MPIDTNENVNKASVTSMTLNSVRNMLGIQIVLIVIPSSTWQTIQNKAYYLLT